MKEFRKDKKGGFICEDCGEEFINKNYKEFKNVVV